jgi:LysM repeat protein
MRSKWSLVAAGFAALVLVVAIVPVSAAPKEDDCNIIHIVQRGETMYSISRRYGVSVSTIASANGIVNPNVIYAGQRLVIPVCRPTGVVHVVQPGETLTQISLRYGVSVYAIAQANGIANPNYIYVGQRLFIPGSAPAPGPYPTKTPSPPATLPGPWHGEYFDNVGLSGTAYTTREDATIDFNWGSGPPAGGMPSNYFSVRWTGTFSFSEGTYRFYGSVDDGIRVYVDGVQIIDGWHDGSYRTYTGDQTLGAGDHAVKVEFYDSVDVARIRVSWQKIAGPTATPGPTAGPTAVPGSGWSAQFYNNETLSGDPVVTRVDPWIGFEWGTGGPAAGVWADGFSARWRTTLSLNTDHYRFCTMSDDGSRIWVNGTLVLDEWHANGGVAYCGTYWVTTGNYEVVVEYYEHGGNALIYMWWEPY